MSIFYDVDAFMKAAGHGPDQKKVGLYLDLVREEIGELEEAIYETYRAATRKLLVKHNAEDLLPMLGLEEETNEHDVS